ILPVVVLGHTDLTHCFAVRGEFKLNVTHVPNYGHKTHYLYSFICAAQFRQTLILGFSCLFFDNTAAAIMTVPNRMMIVKQIISVTITPVLTLALLRFVAG